MRLVPVALAFSTTGPDSQCDDGAYRVRFRLAITALALLVGTSSLRAETVFLGPIRYLSVDDSPFDLSGVGSDFFLEDFEDGELNTPGVRQLPPSPVLGELSTGTIMPPGEFTYSVDADDGMIAGRGHDGHALRSRWLREYLSFPPIRVMALNFEFDATVLGAYPEAFGIVLTDGMPGSALALTIEDPEGERHTMRWDDVGDESLAGTTADDRFFGVTHAEGISQVYLSQVFHGFSDIDSFQLDHLQYGHTIPEPSGQGVFCTCVMLSLLLLYRTRRIQLFKSSDQPYLSVERSAPGEMSTVQSASLSRVP